MAETEEQRARRLKAYEQMLTALRADLTYPAEDTTDER